MKIDKENFMKYNKNVYIKRLIGIGNYISCLFLVIELIELK